VSENVSKVHKDGKNPGSGVQSHENSACMTHKMTEGKGAEDSLYGVKLSCVW
jgi:hypothetical protein